MDLPSDLPIEDIDYETVPVDFYIYFKSWQQSAVEELAADLRQRQFDVDISWSEYANKWLVLATYQLELFPVGFDELVMVMQRLAEDSGGEFDGWERPMSEQFIQPEP